MLIAHLLASPFYGGPERQVLGLAKALRGRHDSVFLSFAEGGFARAFLVEANAAGFESIELCENWPHAFRSIREITAILAERNVNILCTSGYKPDILGIWAARRTHIPAIAIAHGWTGATRKVRINETLDRWIMRKYDAVVSVSQGQADKVRRAGVSTDKMVTIPNAVDVKQAKPPSSVHRQLLESYFPRPPKLIVAAAGRLSPEKGFDLFLDAASQLTAQYDDVGFVLIGDGPLGEILRAESRAQKLDKRLVFTGFRTDMGDLLPNVDLLVIPSYTEGLPVILLEALAAGVPIVATRVGGIPEVIVDGVHGLLVPPGNPDALASGIGQLVQNEVLRNSMKTAGPIRISAEYNTELQAKRYETLFTRLLLTSDMSELTLH